MTATTLATPLMWRVLIKVRSSIRLSAGGIETTQDKSDLEGDRFVEVEGDLAIGKAAETVFGLVQAGQFTNFGDQVGIAIGRKEQVLVHLTSC